LGTEEIEVSPELQQVLWACYMHWQGNPLPPDERTIHYGWIAGPYERRFGTTFHQIRLRQLMDLGFLERVDIAGVGYRRYYKIVDPDRLASLLEEWDLT
jgi:hypothetical protein